jgi:hypothetical protein
VVAVMLRTFILQEIAADMVLIPLRRIQNPQNPQHFGKYNFTVKNNLYTPKFAG